MNNKSVLGAIMSEVMLIGITMFLFANNLFAQTPEILWENHWTGEGYYNTSQDLGYSVQETTDGGYIVAGVVYNSTTFADAWLIKTDAQGDTLWTKTFGGTGFQRGWSVRQTTDGGYIIAVEQQVPWPFKLWFIKTDAQGDTLWTKLYGTSEYKIVARSVQQTTDGGYILAGQGQVGTSNYWDVLLVKTDSYGDTLWTTTCGGGDAADRGYSVQQTTDGGYIIAGETFSFGPGINDYPNGYLIKADANGDTLWTKVYGGIESDELHSVKETSDGGYIVTGWTKSYGAGGCDVWLLKTDAQGDTLWTRTYGGESNDAGLSIQITSDGGYVIAGWTILPDHTESDVYLIKTDAEGNLLWELTCENTNGPDNGQSVQQTLDSGYIIAGQYSVSTPWDTDVYLIKIGQEVGIEEEAFIPFIESGIAVSPNPLFSAGKVNFSLSEPCMAVMSIYDVSGRLVNILVNAELEGGDYTINVDTAGMTAGVYMVRLRAGENVSTGRFILLHQ